MFIIDWDGNMSGTEKNKEFNYSVLSIGELMSGFNKARVIKNLTHITRMETGEIEDKFFNKDNREIKILSDLNKAKRYQGKFLRAGLAAVIQMNFNKIVKTECVSSDF